MFIIINLRIRMKKISFILMLACVGFFAACSDDKKDPVPPADKDYAKEIASKYLGELVVVAPLDAESEPIEQKSNSAIEVKHRSENKIDLALKNFVFLGDVKIDEILLEDIKVEGNDTEVKIAAKDFPNFNLAGLEGITISVKGNKVIGNTIDLDLAIEAGFPKPITVAFKGDKSSTPAGKAEITEITVKHEGIEKVTINEVAKTISIEPKKDVAIKDLTEVVIEYKLSEGATATPASGTSFNLTSGRAEIDVTGAYNENNATYTIKVGSEIMKFFDMEEWISDHNSTTPKYFKPIGGWATPNAGTYLLQSLSGNRYSVVEETKAENVYAGTSSAKIETLLTAGTSKIYPGVTPGTMFLGIFKLDLMDQTKSARFGIAIDDKPLEVRGYYKYTPGEKFYEVPNLAQKNEVVEIKDKVDECSIDVYVYEYDKAQSDKDDAQFKNPYSTYITGKDLKDANGNYNSKIIAKAHLEDGTKKDTFTEFKLKLNYTSYDPMKHYRIAVVATPSKEGDLFKGGDGSTLWLDNIEIITE